MSEISNRIFEKNNEIYNEHSWNPSTWISVSNIKEILKTPFDKESVAQKTFDKHYEDQNSEYYHMTVEQIIGKWNDKAERSIRNGNLCDSYIELKYNEQFATIPDFKKDAINECIDMEKKFIGIDNCLKDFTTKQFCFDTREQKLLLPYTYKGKTYVINGRFDAIFTKDNRIILIDWKNSEDIKTENKWQKLLGPCSKLDDCDMNLFSIQLYLYKYMLENVYGFTKEIIPCVIQFPSHKDYFYKVFKPTFEYDEKMIEKIIKYVIEQKMSSIQGDEADELDSISSLL